MLFFHKKQKCRPYDREKLRPVILTSICTGEKTAGFRHRDTGKFTADRLIRSEADLQEFMTLYGILERPPEEY